VQYTRNMVTGASTANLAVVLVDARTGVTEQTRRHAYLASLLRLPHLLVCVNKMDLVNHDEAVYEAIRVEFTEFATRLGIRDIAFVPISALHGDNIVDWSPRMPWFRGAPVLRHLEEVYIASDRNLEDPRFPVQYVVRPHDDAHHDFRGYAGQVAGGVFRRGDPVVVLPSGHTSRIRDIRTHDTAVDVAYAPMSVTLLLEDDVDVSRGDLIAVPPNVPYLSTEVQAMVCWMSEEPLVVGRKYALKHTSRSARAIVRKVEHRVNIRSLEPEEDVTSLKLNEIGMVTLRTTVPLAFDAYARNRQTGGFIVMDEATNATLAAGMIVEPTRPPPRPDGEPEYMV
jgi:bifunctional enzyme CysN/CysC